MKVVCKYCNAIISENFNNCPWCGKKQKEKKKEEKIPCPDCDSKMTHYTHVFWYCSKCKSFKG